jgi:hypothetical protein
MSILGQTKMVEKVTEGIDLKNTLIDIVKEINQFGGFMESNEKLLGHFKSVLVFEDDSQPTIELYIGARIVEKEVSDEK